MDDSVLTAGYQDWRFAIFASVFAVFALLETLFPKKERVQPRGQRTLTNIGMAAIDTVVVRVLFPAAAVGAAIWAEANGWGILNIFPLPGAVAGVLAFFALDLAIYAQHVASHHIPILWRVHRVHHADRDLDATSGIRFHPIEITLSMVFKIAVVIALGAPALAVFIFEVVLNAAALATHANLKIPGKVDRILRYLVVTPDMHRIHHSVHRDETDANYGFNLAIWDRIFGTYIENPRDGHSAMALGLPDQQTDAPSKLTWSLIFPFKPNVDEAASVNTDRKVPKVDLAE
ncbi:MAG: sterol desaturase family protein [Pseudomonadota bacterium]